MTNIYFLFLGIFVFLVNAVRGTKCKMFHLFFSTPVAPESACCLPEPWTKHITAPKQHGILLYLPTAAPVLPTPSLLKPPLPHKQTLTYSHIFLHKCTHSPHHTQLNECTEGRGEVRGGKPSHSSSCLTEGTFSAAVC